MDASQMAKDAMVCVGELSAILLIVGGVAFADLTIGFLVRLVRKAKGNLKW